MTILTDTLLYLSIVGAVGWALCWGFGYLMDWALNIEEGNS